MGLIFTVVTCVPIAVGYWCTPSVLRAVGFANSELELATTFARWSILSILPMQCFHQLKVFLQAQQNVYPALFAALVGAVVNAAANQLLVKGVASWRGFGFTGSPIATATTHTCMCVVLAIYAVRCVCGGGVHWFHRVQHQRNSVACLACVRVSGGKTRLVRHRHRLLVVASRGICCPFACGRRLQWSKHSPRCWLWGWKSGRFVC